MDLKLPERARAAYEPERLLSSGSQGRVVLARHRVTGRHVALKIADQGPADQARARIACEAELTRRVSHANLASIVEHDTGDSAPWLAREYLPGPTLCDHVPRAGLPWQRACAIAAQLAEALAEVHKAGLLHRDIKSANVMMAHNGLWKLTDFDVACASADPGATVAGTPGYLAPELLVGKPASERSDVYGLGVVLHLMLTGELPFGDCDPFQRMTRCLEAEPARLRKVRPGSPEELDEVLAAALRKDPAERTATMRAFADQLWRLVLGENAAQRIKRSTRLVWGRAPAPSRARETAKAPVSRPAVVPPVRASLGIRRHAVALMAALLVLGGGLMAASRTAIGEDPQNEPLRMMREAAARAAAMGMGNGVAGEAVRRTVR